MANSNNKITAPVRLTQDVATVVGCGSDLGSACTSSNINKWSKCKPIRYYTSSGGMYTQPLTDAQRRGMTSEISAGYEYGVKLATGTGTFDEVHDINFEYHQPRGVAYNEGFRMRDFDGYDHAAVATLSGTLPSTGYYDADHSFNVYIYYDSSGSNTTGIDYAAAITAMGYSIGDCYPMILASNTAKTGTFYAQALFNADLSTPAPTTLLYNSAWQRNFFCNFNTFPDSAAGNWLFSVFLTYKVSTDSFPVDGTWFAVNDRLFMSKPFGVPNCIAQTLTMSAATVCPPVLTPTSVSAASLAVNAMFTYNVVSDSRTFDYKISFQIGTAGVPATVTASGLDPDAEIRAFRQLASYDDMGVAPISGQSFTLFIEVSTKWTGQSTYDSRSIRTYTYTLTYP